MTLILSQITRDYVIQVSDRRLTRPDGSVFDDDSNKAVLYNHHFAFAYTGLAQMSTGEPTDRWLLNTLVKQSNRPFNEALHGVCKAATATIGSNPLPKSHKRLAIVGVGWVSTDRKSGLLPCYVSISNFQNRNGEWSSEVSDEFTVLCTSLDRGSLHRTFVAGQPIDPGIKNQLDRIAHECTSRHIGPGELARLLMASVQSVAHNNPLVGSNIMITSIPRAAVEHIVANPGPVLELFAPPSRKKITFLHVPSNASEPVRYGPKSVAAGTAMGEFEVRPLPPGYKFEPPAPKHVFALTRLVERESVFGLERSAELIGAGFRGLGVGMETSIDDWKKGAPCPHYGAVVYIRGPSDEIDKVGQDKRFFLLSRNETDLQVKPDNDWLEMLQQWSASRGVSADLVQRVTQEIQGMTKAQVIEYIRSSGVLIRSS
jgi:hypothetical protein